MKTALFFLRHNNDLDHICPIITYLTSERDWSIEVIVLDSEFLTDFRVSYLKTFKVNIYVRSEKNIPEILTHIKNCFQLKKGVIAFDWIHKGHSIFTLAKKVSELALKLDIPLIALPHGDNPHAGDMIRIDEIENKKNDIYEPVKIFDYLVSPNKHCAKRYYDYLSKEQIFIAGSSRFSNTWVNKLTTLLSDQRNNLPITTKHKFALFLRNEAYPINWEEIIYTCLMFDKIPGVHLLIVHHSRHLQNNRLAESYPELFSNSFKNSTFIFSDVYSGFVTRWADTIIDIGTSMVSEAIQLKKNIICPEYMHSTRSTSSLYLKESIVLSREELLEKVYSLKENVFQNNRKYYQQYEEAMILSSNKTKNNYLKIFNSEKFLKKIPTLSKSTNSDGVEYNGLIYKFSNLKERFETLEDNFNDQHNKFSNALENINKLLKNIKKLNETVRVTKEDYGTKIKILYDECSKYKLYIHDFIQEYVTNTLMELKETVDHVYIYGAGVHTYWLIHKVKIFDILTVKHIIEDFTAHPKLLKYNSLIINSVDISEDDTSVTILSSDTAQEKMKTGIIKAGKNLNMLNLYKELYALTPFEKVID